MRPGGPGLWWWAMVLALGLVPGTLLADCPQGGPEPAAMRERLPPEPVTPVTRDGIRYEAIHWGKARGLGQNGGYIAAVDAQSGKELWVLKVWDVCYGDLEPDRQDRFVTSLKLSADGALLLVAGEDGEAAVVDLASRSVVSPPSSP